MSLVHYYPGRSLFHRLDPRVKMVWLVCMFLLAFAFNHPLHLSILLAIVLALWVHMRIPYSELKLFFKALTVVAILTFIFQLLFCPGEHVLVSYSVPRWIPYLGGTSAITLEGLINGIAMALRLFVIVLTMPAVTMSTSIEQLVIGLVKSGMPYEVAFAFTTALNLLPVLQGDAAKTIEAQKARAFTAIEKGSLLQRLKAFAPLIVPLMVGALKKGQQLEIAMESRAFGAYKKRTYLIEIKMRKLDWLFLAIVLGGTIVCLALRITMGFGVSRL